MLVHSFNCLSVVWIQIFIWIQTLFELEIEKKREKGNSTKPKPDPTQENPAAQSNPLPRPSPARLRTSPHFGPARAGLLPLARVTQRPVPHPRSHAALSSASAPDPQVHLPAPTLTRAYTSAQMAGSRRAWEWVLAGGPAVWALMLSAGRAAARGERAGCWRARMGRGGERLGLGWEFVFPFPFLNSNQRQLIEFKLIWIQNRTTQQ